MEPKYRELINQYEAEASKWNRKSNRMGVVKLALFFVFLFLVFAFWSVFRSAVCGLAAGISFVLFAAASVRHEDIIRVLEEKRGLCEIVKADQKRRLGEWTEFSDTGEEYVDEEHGYAVDLDIVGQNSLFQFINRTHTYFGREKLAADLLHPTDEYPLHEHPLDADEEIRRRQEAVEELASDYEWAARMEYYFSKIGVDRRFPELIAELENPRRFLPFRHADFFVGLLRGVTCVAIAFLCIYKTNEAICFLGILLLLQLALGMLGDYHIKNYLGYTRTAAGKMAPYCEIVRAWGDRSFHSERLCMIQAHLAEASEGIRQLSVISSHMKYTVHPVSRFILDGFLLWSFKNAFDFQEWKLQYGEQVRQWFMLLGETESLMSFSGLAWNCSTVCLPQISGSGRRIAAQKIGHPLLGNEERVCNDFRMEDSIVMISGSNMSGKSTFMRTVGINVVLAGAGSYVCAEWMSCPRMRILTSMRIADRTTEGISSFYAELLRIRKIIDAAAESDRLLFFIDEIFRGTNSADRIKGAEGVIEKLHGLNACGIITTHDLEICRLGDKKGIVNYSFYEEYRGDEMYFDYQIKEGISKTTNAEFLLRKVGIL